MTSYRTRGIHFRLILLLLAFVGGGGCVGSQSERCGAIRCSKGEECDKIHDLCIQPIQRVVCANLVDGDLCEVDGVPGFHCDQGVCIPGVCGDGVNDETEECDDGPANSDTTPDACRTTCRLPRCGDGVLDASNREQCDNGDANSDTTPDACRLNCQAARCGDGTVDATEACDDGNFARGDGCGPTCQLESCGNSIVDPGEECDDGNATQGDGCGATCLIERCGNGVIDVIGGAGPEVCDDGNVIGGDGCSATCDSDETCGNGVVDGPAGEACDDGNLVGGDGCSSDCLSEFWSWQRAPILGSANLYGMTYDAARGRLVAVGGAPAQTWEHVGGRWERTPVVDTPASMRHALAYDAVRDLVVFYGEGRTVEYDGAEWMPVSTANSPPSLIGSAITWDTAGQQILLFGGATPVVSNETWSYNGTDWTQLSPATTPPARMGHALVDAPGIGVVLFGGCADFNLTSCAGAVLNDVWIFASGDWSNQSPPSPPVGRWMHAMATDVNRSVVVLMGGYDAGLTTAYDDTWELSVGGWSSVGTGNFDPRGAHAMAYDPRVPAVVALGGCQQVNSITSCAVDAEDTIAYDGTFTVQAHQPPSGRIGAAFAHDSVGHQVVLFGGFDGTNELGDTWTYDGYRWEQQSPATAPAPTRAMAAAAYDPTRDVVVLFGGCDGVDLATTALCGTAPLADTWEYDGTTWTQRTTTTTPPGRSLHKMTFDPGRGAIVMAGGTLPDAWSYNGTDWTEITNTGLSLVLVEGLVYDAGRANVVAVGVTLGSAVQVWDLVADAWQPRVVPPPHPAFRVGAAIDYHPMRGTVVVSGGCGTLPDASGCANPLLDAWDLTDNGWLPIGTAPTPPARWGASFGFHPQLGGFFLFGGQDVLGYADDTWVLGLSPPFTTTVAERCHNGVDDDGDGQIDCADPECAQRSCGPNGTGCVSGYCP